ncbi:MAG: ABC transporter permease [Dehalococcoidia bacterium]
MAQVLDSAIPLLIEAVPKPRRGSSRLLRSLLRARMALFGVFFLALVVVCALAAPLLAPHDPADGTIVASKLPPAWEAKGESAYLLGTDEVGRDILSRTIYGARVSLTVGIMAVALAGAIGVLAGMLTGYYRGRLDDVIMRIVDIQLAIPFILFAIAMLAVTRPGLRSIIIVLGITGWVTYARVVRGQVLSLREKEFVEAARCIGARDPQIMWRHILPNTWASIIILASFAVASTILAEAALSFLGLGVPPNIATWGGMIAAGRDQIITGRWWIYTFPGVAIMLTVLSINAVGDWLRDYLDPRLRV